MMKGRKVELLPDPIKKVFYQMVESKHFTSQEVAEKINVMLSEYKGEKLVESIDDNTVWREGKRLDAILSQKSEAEVMVQALGEKYDLSSLGETGRVVMNMLQSAIFRTSTHLMSGNNPVDPETLGDLVLAVSRLQRSAVMNQELEKRLRAEERQQALDDAEKAVVDSAKNSGVPGATIKDLRKAISSVRL